VREFVVVMSFHLVVLAYITQLFFYDDYLKKKTTTIGHGKKRGQQQE
jgi:hypothetical protein